MSRFNSFKETPKKKDQFNDIKTLLKDKNLNPNKIKDLKELLSLTLNPVIKRFNFEYLLTFLLKYLNAQNEAVFYEFLFQSCELGKLKNVKILLEEEFNPNSQNELGETPLHIAIAKNDIDLVKLLIKYEPDITITTYKDGLTAVNYAEICGNKKIIQMVNDLNNKKLIKNEIIDCINNGMNGINNNIKINNSNDHLFKDSSYAVSRNNTILDQIQNYNGEKMSILTDEEMSSSILSKNLNNNLSNTKLKNYSENNYINTQTIINESDYYEENSPKNKNIYDLNNHNFLNERNKNMKLFKNEIKFLSSSLKKKEEKGNHYNNLSVNPLYIQSLTTCHTFNKDLFEFPSPLNNHMSLKPINKKENLLKFIEEINLPKEYVNNLLDNGFDVLDVLISQTKKGIALSYQNLKDIGIKLPGERAKILVHLEEIAGNFDFPLDKNVVYSNEIIDNKNNSLYKFLCKIGCEQFVQNFLKNGYYNIELLFYQICSKQPVNETILINDLGFGKNEAQKILSHLIEGSKEYAKKIKNKNFILEENNNYEYCNICNLF